MDTNSTEFQRALEFFHEQSQQEYYKSNFNYFLITTVIMFCCFWYSCDIEEKTLTKLSGFGLLVSMACMIWCACLIK